MDLTRLFLIACAAVAVPSVARAQRVEITPFGGRQFGGEIGIRRGRLDIPAAWNYGLTLDIALQPGTRLEFLYARQETSLDQEDQTTGDVTTLFDLAVEYFQTGVLYEPEFFRTTRPFGALTAGVTHYDAQEEGRSGEWRFSGGFAGGVKQTLTSRIGVRVEGRVLFTFISSADEIFCAPPNPCLTGVEGAIVAQGLVTGGLILSF